MTQLPTAIIPDPGPNAGPKMALCTPMQRRFVMALLELGDMQHSRAARMAGSKAINANSLAQSAHEMFHNRKVQEAIHEQALGRLQSVKIMAVSQLAVMAQSATTETVRLKALLAIMNRTGLHEITEHRVETVNINSTLEEDLDQLALLAKQSGQPLSPEWQRMVDARASRKSKNSLNSEEPVLIEHQPDPDADILENFDEPSNRI
jgi:hypothetical protein